MGGYPYPCSSPDGASCLDGTVWVVLVLSYLRRDDGKTDLDLAIPVYKYPNPQD